MKRYIAVLLLGLVALPGCTLVSLEAPKPVLEAVQQASLPRQHVEVLARVLKETKDGLAAEYTAGRLTKIEFLATEGPVQRATAALEQAGQLLHAAADDNALASTALEPGKKAAYAATAAAEEALAVQRTSAAEADIGPLRDTLNRVRGVPPTVKP